MFKSLVFIWLFILSTVAVAEPDQIDIVGLTPGISTYQDFKSKAASVVRDAGMVEIGGYKLICKIQFDNGVLAMFGCSTGDGLSNASNIEIHETLVRGFTEKFGTPSTTTNIPVKNGFGREFNVQTVTWMDKQGNYLALRNMGSRADSGSILMLSASRAQADLDAAKRKEEARKF